MVWGWLMIQEGTHQADDWKEKKSCFDMFSSSSLSRCWLLSSFWKNLLSYIFRICAIFCMYLKCKEIKRVNSKGNQSWIFIHWKDRCWSWNSNTLATWCEELAHWKRSWCWERLKAAGERDDSGWDGWVASRLNGHEFEQAPGVGDGQGSLACSGPWSHKESDTTEQLNWTELMLNVSKE